MVKPVVNTASDRDAKAQGKRRKQRKEKERGERSLEANPTPHDNRRLTG